MLASRDRALEEPARDRALVGAMPWVFVLIWSTGFVVARYGMPHAPPFGFLAWRYALSLLALGLWIALARAPWPRERGQWAHLAATGCLMHAGYLGGVWAAVKHGIPAGTVALIVGLQPLLTAAWVSLTSPTHRLQWRQWLGLLLGLGGLVLVVWRRMQGGEVTSLNLGLSVAALFSITAGTLYQKRFVQPLDVRSASFIQLCAALLVSLPVALMETEPVRWHPQLLGALAWSVGVLTLGGSSLLYLLIQRGAATVVASLMYLVPPCTALLAWLLFNEVMTWTMAAGMAVTVMGVGLAVHGSHPKALISSPKHPLNAQGSRGESA
ncbi:DMT(drug/metabolite transporter) superfamily permease [Burkholderiales bacterium JOSHI_001]|nr:DMT(drug/metabolite transporter) superfamily permease [Burkholderiales bacterium JOSHI_001]